MQLCLELFETPKTFDNIYVSKNEYEHLIPKRFERSGSSRLEMHYEYKDYRLYFSFYSHLALNPHGLMKVSLHRKTSQYNYAFRDITHLFKKGGN